MLSVMNSLNIVSRLTTTPPPSPPRSRTGSHAQIDSGGQRDNGDSGQGLDMASIDEKLSASGVEQEEDGAADAPVKTEEAADDRTPLLASGEGAGFKEAPGSRLWTISGRIGQAVIHGVKVVFTTITAPGRYVIACFYDDQGHFSAILPLRNFKNLLSRRRRKSTAQAVGLSSAPETDEKKPRQSHRSSSKRSTSVDSNASSSTVASSDGEGDPEKSDDSPARHTRSRTAAAQSHEASAPQPQRRSMKVKLQGNEEVLRKRRAAKEAAQRQKSKASSTDQPTTLDDVAQALKSPSSPAGHNSKMTRYPRAPAPPRPLVPRRQPSYTLSYSPDTPKKTLIIDLDETLIHSMAKGGRMSTGHMVEVRLGGPIPTPTSPSPTQTNPISQQATMPIGPGVPILYYVHERPNCHDFLRKVSKWYNLIVFTASVQEYADPVIDWLERERRYFGGRYYRQHCTLRNGAYIKDLAQVEPDLSRVMILDNSPMSYIFHEGMSTIFPLHLVR
jgi:CTD nuclear envelope phosphatase 1